MLRLADLRAGETLCDIGCGDGRTLIYAIKQYGVNEACGYELNEDVFNLAKSHCQAALSSEELDRVKLVHGDGMDVNFDDLLSHDVILLYLLPMGLKLLAQKLTEGLRERDDYNSDCNSNSNIKLINIDSGGSKRDSNKNINIKKGCRIISQGWPIPGLQVFSKSVTMGGSNLFCYLL